MRRASASARALARSRARTFSETPAKPSTGCCVRQSKTLKRLSRLAATSLFISMSLRSNLGVNVAGEVSEALSACA